MAKHDGLVTVRREQYPFENAGEFPREMTGAVCVPGVGPGCVHYCFLVDFARRAITCWTIDLSRVYEKILARFAQRSDLAVPWNQATLAKFIEVIHFPHSVDRWGDWLYVSFIEGGFLLALDVFSDAYEVIFDESAGDGKIYSSTNQIRDGRIYFTRWELEETFAHERDRARPVSLEIGVYNLADRTFRNVAVIPGPDDIHYTAVSPDHSKIIIVEMTQDPVAPMPIDDVFEKLPASERRTILESSIHTSELITYDVRTGGTHRLRLPGGPAHIEWEEREADVFYLSSHYLVTNNDTLYAFGNVRIDRFRLVDGRSVLERSYESPDLLRGPSHRLTTYEGRPLIAIPVYPNQIDIVDRSTMSQYKRICLTRRAPAKLDFREGPVRYPRASQEKTPYSIDGQDGTPYLYLSSVWDVSAFDFEAERKIASVIYNRDKPIILMGHASKFDGLGRTDTRATARSRGATP